MAYETFIVVECNERHGFARLEAEAGASELCHAELYPEGGEGAAPEQLKVGDRVTGLRRGQSVTRLAWVDRAPVPPVLLEEARALLAGLREAKLTAQLAQLDPDELAQWRWRRPREALGLLAARLEVPVSFFFEDVHPFQDPDLLRRMELAMKHAVPDFKVEALEGKVAFRVEPGSSLVEAQPAGPDSPSILFEPLIAHANGLLEKAGAALRWTATRENWLLADRALTRLLVKHGLVDVPLVH